MTGVGYYSGQFGRPERYLILFLMYLKTIERKQFCSCLPNLPFTFEVSKSACIDLNPNSLQQVFKLIGWEILKCHRNKDKIYLVRAKGSFDVSSFPSFSVIKNWWNELANGTT